MGRRSAGVLYDYDDSQLAYEAFISDFETAWIHAEEIPEDVVAGKRQGNQRRMSL